MHRVVGTIVEKTAAEEEMAYERRLHPLLIASTLVAWLLAVPAAAADNTSRLPPKLEIGIDRSNMATEWTISPPGEPNIYPFNGPYNGVGVFEARRVAVFDGIARLHPQWFRDGFGPDRPEGAQLFVDMVRQVHARGMKILAVVSHTGSDFDKKDYIDPTNGELSRSARSTSQSLSTVCARISTR